MIDEQAVAQKLFQSRAAHTLYRYALSQHQPTDAKTHLATAARLRDEADALDPQHVALAWQDDGLTHPHDDLRRFYTDQLSR